ncbi:uncharacterized protein SETTUDRAFT_40015 [Exserohilum turcica Et28A]|uniref:Uncharacterized protein n=1 Tax=Exserohilum turcicum (strain 28A) TaxID=671987 RepID=R0IL14_EXST2|nr:uncharacterized protein SETTUDRAFT_40015 [Exserohilum turcica Et28A]EOA85755.1 hypothetical protein SETTUDRAFT_40015 [Exserohilum turcica Et28A]
MDKQKWRKRLCARYKNCKNFWKHQLPSTSSPSDDTRTRFGFTRILTPPHKDEDYQREVNIAIRDGDGSPWSGFHLGVALVDTQSEYNLVSAQFLRVIGVQWKQSPDDANILQMDETRIVCLGEIDGRWRATEAKRGALNFRPRFEISTFKVVELSTFDIIIGRQTINECGILVVNRHYLGAFRTVPVRVDSASTLIKKQQAVEERRKKEQEELKKYEEEQESIY